MDSFTQRDPLIYLIIFNWFLNVIYIQLYSNISIEHRKGGRYSICSFYTITLKMMHLCEITNLKKTLKQSLVIFQSKHPLFKIFCKWSYQSIMTSLKAYELKWVLCGWFSHVLSSSATDSQALLDVWSTPLRTEANKWL